MNSPELPDVVLNYLAQLDHDGKRAVADLFAPDAEVTDDGTTYRGREEIGGWLAGPASEYITTSTRLSAELTDRTVVVTTRVEGNFPGGRIDLRNVFSLNPDGRISTLIITAVTYR